MKKNYLIINIITQLILFFYIPLINSKCVCDVEEQLNQDDNLNQYIIGLNDLDQIICTERQLSINTQVDIKNFEWIFMDGTISTEETINLRADVQQNETCGKFEIKIEKTGGEKLHFCHIFYTQPYINTGDTSKKLTQFSDFKVNKLENILAQRYDKKHFSSGSVPIAPKYDIGSYVMYSEPGAVHQKIHVIELDQDNNIIESYDTGKKGKPYDIVSTKYGFVFMARDEPHHLYITAYDIQKKKIKWDVNLINNGIQPNENTDLDQIDLGDAFGTTAMYNPHNGRLVNARERIFAVFAHYNFFGYYDNGSRNVHTGDSSVFLDLETGQKTGHAFTWSTSHSLYQQVLYDGKNIFTSVLGDAYPQSIKNHAISGFEGLQDDINNITDNVIEPDFIPGNGQGMTAGRLGGLIQIDDNKYVQVHSQRPATSTFGNGGNSIEDKLVLTFFNENLQFDSEVVLKPGNLIQTIKSAKYGNNLIIAYTTISESDQDFIQAEIKETDIMNVLLVDFNGIILQDFDVSESVLSAADDWEVLTDGSVIFSFVDINTFELNIYKTEGLEDSKRKKILSQCSSQNYFNDNNNLNIDEGNDDDDDDDDIQSHIQSVSLFALLILVISLY